MSLESDERKKIGNFRQRITNVDDIKIKDFDNPWNFYCLLLSDDATLNKWCRNNELLPETIKCLSKKVSQKSKRQGGGDVVCGGNMFPKVRGDRSAGEVFRCEFDRDHTKAIRTYSLFDKAKMPIPDVMVFIKSYLDKSSLLQCSKFAGVAYKTTAVNWASYIRELFKEYFHRNIKHKKLSGEIEIDESLFGRKVKHHRGDPNKGLRVWVFGMIERSSNTIIMYPVQDRTANTLLPLIQRHVEPGSTIYSDGWSAYMDLNSLGYNHFTVIHKYSFKKTYKNTLTEEIITVHTNRIEGAWKHAKDHFKRMSGTKYTQFEGHMAEVMWRAVVKGNIYQSFFDLLRSVYTLNCDPEYEYTTPLFDTLGDSAASVQNVMVHPALTDADTETDSESTHSDHLESDHGTSNPASSSESSGDRFPPNLPVPQSAGPSVDDADIIALSSSLSVSDDDHDSTLIGAEGGAEPTSPLPIPGPSHKPSWVTARKKKTPGKSSKKKEKVCCPQFFEENSPQLNRRRRQKKTNPYEKSAYVWSSDDDFQ